MITHYDVSLQEIIEGVRNLIPAVSPRMEENFLLLFFGLFSGAESINEMAQWLGQKDQSKNRKTY